MCETYPNLADVKRLVVLHGHRLRREVGSLATKLAPSGARVDQSAESSSMKIPVLTHEDVPTIDSKASKAERPDFDSTNEIKAESVLHTLSNCEILRLEVDDEHYYYGGAPDTEKQYYLSVTKVLDVGAPFPEGLRQYLRVSSYEEQKERLQMTGDRGSKLHEALDKLMRRKGLNLKHDYQTTYEKDAIAMFLRFMRFLQPGKYDTELVVADPDLRVAGTLDFKGFVDEWRLACLLEPNKFLDIDSDGDVQLKQQWLSLADNKKRVHVIIDWKFTGRNAYSHKVQVAAYKTMNNKTRTGRPVVRAFTWRYSSRHKHGFDFSESLLTYQSFKRIYETTIEYLGEFPMPPSIKKYPEFVRLYEEIKPEKEK